MKQEEVMVEQGIPCSAPEHVEECPGVADTIDHFTPRGVGRLVGISQHQLDKPDNLQPLSRPCHAAKDADTPLRIEVLRMEKKGIIFSWEEHRKIFSSD